MHSQDAAVGLMQPAQHNDLVAHSDAIQTCLNLRIQDQIGIWCTFVTLARCVGRRSQPASDTADGAQREVVGG
jgi:hypothetical protein